MKKTGLHIILASVQLLLLLAVLASCHKTDPVPETPFVRLQEGLQLKSNLLHKTINYAVLLPEGYQESDQRFPVVYLLHGFGDDEQAWYKGGNIQWYADQYAATLGDVIFVMPEGFNTYWVNKYNGNFPIQEMLVSELVPHIDSAFRSKKEVSQRAVMGYSMGGYGALTTVAKNPSVFGTSIALSMSFRTDAQYLSEPQSVFDYQWAPVFGGMGVAGQARLNDYFLAYSPFHYFAKEDDVSQSGQHYFIDCGDDEESLAFTANALHSLMQNRQIKHEFRMRSGGHSWDYWHASLPEAFAYMRNTFDGLLWPDDSDIKPERRQPETNQLITHTATANMPEFKVLKPANYDESTTEYPLILLLNDPVELDAAQAGEQLLQQLNQAIYKQRLPACLVVEMSFQQPFNTDENLSALRGFLSENYRLRSDGIFAVIVANGEAGNAAFASRESLSSQFNALLLFNADLPDTLNTTLPSMAFYLDMTDQHTACQAYERLYEAVREQEISYEYRVRQGQQLFADFEAGLNDAMIFIKNNLKR